MQAECAWIGEIWAGWRKIIVIYFNPDSIQYGVDTRVKCGSLFARTADNTYLNATERRDTHIEKYAVQNGHWNQLKSTKNKLPD